MKINRTIFYTVLEKNSADHLHSIYILVSHSLYLPILIFFFEKYKGIREMTITAAITKKIKAKQLTDKHANQPL